MTSRDLLFISLGTLLAVVGITASFLGSNTLAITALILLSLFVLFLLILQRRHQARLQERILYLVNAEKKRTKAASAKSSRNSLDDSNAVQAKKIIGLLQAQQISMELLRREISGGSD